MKKKDRENRADIQVLNFVILIGLWLCDAFFARVNGFMFYGTDIVTVFKD